MAQPPVDQDKSPFVYSTPTSTAESTEAPVDTGLSCLLLLARILEVPAREDALVRQAGLEGQPFSETDILLAAKSLEIKARAVDSRWTRLAASPLPAMARNRDGSGWFLIAKIAPDQSKVSSTIPSRARPSRPRAKSWRSAGTAA